MAGRSSTNAEVIEALRLRRAEMRDSMSALEQALAAPARGRADAWVERVHVALVELFSDFQEHVAVSEGPHGIYRGVLTSAPRLSDEVAGLTNDHIEIKDLIDRLLASVSAAPAVVDVDGIRELGTALLLRLIRTRQRSADLVYEAYQSDIGGEA
jgi:hypothetical protein